MNRPLKSGEINSDGAFSFTVALPNAHSASRHKITIKVSDEVGNSTTTEEAEVVHGGLSNIDRLEIYADGKKWDNNNIVSNPLSTRTYRLSLAVRTKNGISFFLTDNKFVSWNCATVEGKASVDSDGNLTVGANSIGFVVGSLRVTDTASLTSSMTFGAERFSSSISHYSVVTSATQGGDVTGGGIYTPGETVILTAIPNSGYKFTGWSLEGVSVSDTSETTISFIMPERNVVATANFKENLPDDVGEEIPAQYSVLTYAGKGGSVTGDGLYDPGETVTLTAVPDSGYYFSGWTIMGVSVWDITASTITFKMPKGNVIVTANFKEKIPDEPGVEEPVKYSVITSATQGGSIIGSGMYVPGDTVILTAVPDSGYKFTGWILEGVSVSDISASTISFIMPEGDVTVIANFTYTETKEPVDTVIATAGQKVTYVIPSTVNENCYVPYYLEDGKKLYVPMSLNENGVLTFIAPADGEYFLEEREVSFNDIEGHWARDYITSAAARDLFAGIGDGKFGPNNEMTRAMFVTVLWRLAGKPEGGTSTFKDADPDSYYSEALSWASNNGIVYGYGNGLFGVNDNISREQMCTIFIRFLKYLGFDIPEITDALPFADGGAISTWAKESVELCRSLGIVSGRPGNIFDPEANATRAECCTMFIKLISIYLNSK